MLFSINKNFLRVNDSLYEVVRTFPEERVKEVDPIKEWLDASIVFKKEGILYFCNIITDAEIIE